MVARQVGKARKKSRAVSKRKGATDRVVKPTTPNIAGCRFGHHGTKRQDDCEVLREGVRYMFSDHIDRKTANQLCRKMYQTPHFAIVLD